MWRKAQTDDVPFLVFGLGNPGARYATTRHNAGWWVLDALAARHAASSEYSRHQSRAQQCVIDGRRVLLVRPQTYMNISGEAVAAWRREFPAAGWVLLHDDVALPVGQLRLRRQGSAGGHNGVASVIASVKSPQFDRLKIGVGAPPHPADQADYVLSPPSSAEMELLQPVITKAAEVLEHLVRLGFDRAAQLASGGEEKQAERRRKREVASIQGADGSAATEIPPQPGPEN